MIKNSRPLSGVSATTLINSAFNLNHVNRYFRFDDTDSYLRIYSKHHDRRLNEGELPLSSQYLSLRYDSVSLLKRVLKTSVDVDLQNILNSYLISTVAMTARRFSGHEIGCRRGLRSGLIVDQHFANSHYDRGPLPVSFEDFTTSFINYYNNAEDAFLRGTMALFSPKDIAIHTPDFSFGSYKGSDNKKSITKAYSAIVRMRDRFNEFFNALAGTVSSGGNRYHHAEGNPQSFKMRIFTLSGTENSTSYRQGGSTQAINQEDPLRDKNGLYAIIRIPRPRNIQQGQEARSNNDLSHEQQEYDPVYSNLFNAYADCPQLGDAFIALSSCIIVKLDSFLNKACYSYASDFPSLTVNSHEQDYNTLGRTEGYGHSSRDPELPSYQTFGPLAHTILPESLSADVDETKDVGRYGLLSDVPPYAQQEFMDLSVNVDFNGNLPKRSYFEKRTYTGHPIVSHWERSRSGPITRHYAPGSRAFNESAKQFYCWVVNGDARYSSDLTTRGNQEYVQYMREQLSGEMLEKSAASIAAENGHYLFGHGSGMQEPITERSIMGTVAYNVTDKKKYHDFFSFFSPHVLNQEKLYTKNHQALLGNFPITRNIDKRGKGCIYVDQENIAYCPLSGEALKVKTYLRHQNSNTRGGQWGDMVPAGHLIS
jgi:hypothetical protein